MDKKQLRDVLKKELPKTIKSLNKLLSGQGLKRVEKTLERISSGKELPHWYNNLLENGTLPNLDGKTIGSIVEMLFVCVLENETYKKAKIGELKINPAKGVDIPDIDLGIKSPSENYCTSEPFFNAYDRILGNEYDALILLTDYQEAKSKPPLKVKIQKYEYLNGSEIADKNLCSLGLLHREWLLQTNENLAKKFFKFIVHVNQGEWEARQILKLLKVMKDESQIKTVIVEIMAEFEKTNKQYIKKDKEPLSKDLLKKYQDLLNKKPLYEAIINIADEWTIENLREFSRLPNDNEWNRIKRSPLDGKISISYALQWRYNFGGLFRNGNHWSIVMTSVTKTAQDIGNTSN